MKFKVGKKVIVRTYIHMPLNWNSDMFALMGRVVTIAHVNTRRVGWPYKIKEQPGWIWREKDFISITDEKDPNLLFLMRKGNKHGS